MTRKEELQAQLKRAVEVKDGLSRSIAWESRNGREGQTHTPRTIWLLNRKMEEIAEIEKELEGV